MDLACPCPQLQRAQRATVNGAWRFCDNDAHELHQIKARLS